MWGSSHWMHLAEGESAARRAQKNSSESDDGDAGERPDDWKASDTPLPSRRPVADERRAP